MSKPVEWSGVLDCTDRGARGNLSNAVTVLQKDPAYSAARLHYDSFLDRILFSNSPEREWTDEDDYKLTVHMQQVCGMSTVPDHVVAKAVRLVAKQRPRHLVRDWWAPLEWDGVERIALAFEDYWGVECGLSQPCDYVRAASRNLFIGMVARVLKPGCQLDTMVVFEGQQGIRKTSALRALAGESLYMTAHESVMRKDFFEGLPGKLIVEIQEMDAFSRAEISRVKGVISTPVDRYRPSYGRTAQDYPRQSIFVGTTNKDDWGNDETGLRRFWPVKCGAVDVESLIAVRNQLFAEAVVAFKTGATWWEMPDSTTAVQADRQAESAWTGLVLNGLLNHTETTITEVLMRILKYEPHQINRSAELLVGRILRLAGWSKSNVRRSGKQATTWLAPLEGQQMASSDNSFSV